MPTIKHRRGTASEWTASNPILSDGELGFERDTNRFKLGDGLHHWTDLDYFIPDDAIAAAISARPPGGAIISDVDPGDPSLLPPGTEYAPIWINPSASGGGVGGGEIVTAGAGLTKTGSTLAVGAGSGITVAADSVAVDSATVQTKSEKASAGGYASLDGSSKIPIAQIPTGATGTTVSLGDHTHAGVYDPAGTASAEASSALSSHVSALDPHTSYLRNTDVKAGTNVTVDTSVPGEVTITASGAVGGPPTGPAGGDLAGSYPNPTIGSGRVTATHLEAGLIPTALPPNGSAGGDLAGTYPNPTIGAGKVTSTHLEAGLIPTALPPNGNAGGDLSGTYPNPQIATGSIVDDDVNASAAIAQTKIASLTTDLAARWKSWTGTQAAYDAIGTKQSDTLYVVIG